MSSILEYKGYHATVEYDAEDDIFVGEVFGIADSLNFHGTSVEELKAMFRQSIDNYLELCKQIGKNPEKEFRGSFNVRISPELHRKAALEAEKQKITLNQYVLNAIEKSFKQEKLENSKTIIYMPYETAKVDWLSGDDQMRFEGHYKKGMSLIKEENVSYVKN